VEEFEWPPGPQQRGPKSPHKLTPEVMAFIDTQMSGERPPGARTLARAIQTELGLSVHPRSIERALARKKNSKDFDAGVVAHVVDCDVRVAAGRCATRARAARRTRRHHFPRSHRGPHVTVLIEHSGSHSRTRVNCAADSTRSRTSAAAGQHGVAKTQSEVKHVY
jgi:hypothetical protein